MKDNKKTDIKKKKDDNSFILNLLLNNRLAVVLIVALITVSMISFVNSNRLKKEFKGQKQLLIAENIQNIDSLRMNYLNMVVRSFSYGIVSHINENNTEKLKKSVELFTKETDIDVARIIDVFNAKILVSSDAKEEGNIVTNVATLKAHQALLIEEKKYQRIVYPIKENGRRIAIITVDINIIE